MGTILELMGIKRRTKSSDVPRRVLVAEDDDVILELIREACERACPGSIVDGTPSGEVAELLLKCEQKYDLVILDVGLSDRRSGIDVWNACRETNPELHFIFISGMCEDEFRRKLGAATRAPIFLNKPFSITKLARAVSETLDDASENAA